ncbi:quinol dehydrogenase ferredoxin subunit NapH [Shewanella submarina]|uniref:Quinol dehydrogenase ferredoxin subunit NapH n=1 Tax=Shewanella submarina TaxID=2016376 RepID=A0ABV7GHG7_9GAMM|nr:quinol dehydrogenase ferredoxin subunit NapH [Shewanella submarina]MCL1035829.1 quinol dehydrogenase ferredoxin subunit NapH [Shewanella submarina]
MTRQPSAHSRNLWQRNRFLLLRRLSQMLVLMCFLLGPLAGIWIFKGNLSSSLVFDAVPLADPLVTLQSLTSGHLPQATLILGGILVLLLYALLGGRSFCSWVCPVNPITDLAAWLRQKLHLPRTPELPKSLRWYLLALVLLLPAITGLLVWEWVNPVPVIYRAVLFGGLGGLWLLAGVFLLDLFISERAWCGHLCPSGALYSLAGKVSPLRMAACQPQACDMCMKCFDVCPERQILKPALKGYTPKMLGASCTLCGRCIDVCDQKVFSFTNRCRLTPCREATTDIKPNSDIQ